MQNLTLSPSTGPLVSVLMPTRNQAAYIEAALDSILGQDWSNLEIIVMDGASTDGTLEILQQRAEADSRIRFFSAQDGGPADALNRALTQVRGSIVGWLNSDDLYAPGAIGRAVQALSEDPSLLMVYGHGQHLDQSSGTVSAYPTVPPRQVVLDAGVNCFICQPTAFFRYSLVALLGPFDVVLKTAFDFDWWLRAFRSFPERIGFVDAVQAISRLHEDCITRTQGRRVCLESMGVVARYVGEVSSRWLQHQFMLEHEAVTPGDADGRAAAGAACRTLLQQAAVCLAPRVIAQWQDDPRCLAGLPGFAPLDAFLEQSDLDDIRGGAAFARAMSLGTFCHAAHVLRDVGLRETMGPFDWVFSQPAMITHCLEDGFATFLDPSQYEVPQISDRVDPSANVCEHRYYRDAFGVRFMFNHHDLTQAHEHARFTRAVANFRRQMKAQGRSLLVMVSNRTVTDEMVNRMVKALRIYGSRFHLLVLRFVVCEVERINEVSPTLAKRMDQACVIDFPVTSASNGVLFESVADNARLRHLLRGFAGPRNVLT